MIVVFVMLGLILSAQAAYLGQFSIRSHHGRFVSADSKNDRAPRADETQLKSEEDWRIDSNDDGTVCLKSVHGYLVAEPNGEVRNNRQACSGWEHWKIIDVGNHQVAFQSWRGTYLKATPPNHQKPHVMQQTSVQDWEKFSLVPVAGYDRSFWDDVKNQARGLSQRIDWGTLITIAAAAF